MVVEETEEVSQRGWEALSGRVGEGTELLRWLGILICGRLIGGGGGSNLCQDWIQTLVRGHD
jgi:hypothetical protein